MQMLLFSVLLLFVAACWTLVIGSQLGLSAFDIERYAVWRMTWALAYTTAGLSICFVGWIILFSLIKPGSWRKQHGIGYYRTGKRVKSGSSARIWYDGVRCRRPRSGRR